MTGRRVWAALALAAVLGASGCSVWGPEGGPGGAGMNRGPSPSASPVEATIGDDGVQRVEITMGDDLRFTPSYVRARPGVVEFVFHNVGTTAHDVQVEIGSGGQRTGNVNGGATSTVRVTVDEPGRYPFPCVYHVSSGMTGTLEVV